MTVRSDEILSQLDHAFMEPGHSPTVLGNVHFDLADARLSVFSNGSIWAIIFEVVGYNNKSWEFCVDYYLYGNLFSEDGYCPQFSRTAFTCPDLVDENDKILQDRSSIEIWHQGTKHELSTNTDVCGSFHELEEHDRPAWLARTACEVLSHPFFASHDFLAYVIDFMADAEMPGANEIPLLLQTRHWRHPDFVGLDSEARPSEVKCFQILAEAIVTGCLDDWNSQDPSTFNSDWRHWNTPGEFLRGWYILRN